MHYPSMTCSQNGKKTIDSHGEDIDNFTVSKTDMKKVQALYGGAIKKDAVGACFDGFYRCISGIYKFQCIGDKAKFFKNKTCEEFDRENSFRRVKNAPLGVFD